MGLEDFVKEAENVATGQGGQDGQNNSTQGGSINDKTADTFIDSGKFPSSLIPDSLDLATPPK